jgi:hypothetical protein
MNLFIKNLLTLLNWVFKPSFNMFDIIAVSLITYVVYPSYGYMISIACILFFTTLSAILESILFKGEEE